MEATKTENEVKVGDVVFNVWGYSMTIVNFYQVLSMTDKSITVRELTQETVEGSEGFLSGKSIPVVGKFIESAKVYRALKRWSEYTGVYHVSSLDHSSRCYLNKWNGKPVSYNHCD